MRKLICFLVFMPFVLWGGWSTIEYVEIIKKLPMRLQIFSSPVVFYGAVENDKWVPTKFITTEDGKRKVSEEVLYRECYSYAEVLAFGVFDDTASLNSYLSNQVYQVGVSSRGVPIFDSIDVDLAEVYDKFNTANYDLARKVLSDLLATYDQYLTEERQREAMQGGGTAEDSSEVAETTKEVDEALSQYDEDTREEISKTKEETTKAREELIEADLEIAKYNEPEAQEAVRDIEGAVIDFDDGYENLNRMIDAGDISKIQDVINKFQLSSSKLNQAIEHLNNVQGEGVTELKEDLGGALVVISGALVNLNEAKLTGDLNKAKAARDALSTLSHLANVVNSVNDMQSLHKSAKAVRTVKAARVSALDAIISNLLMLNQQIISLRMDFTAHVNRYMDDMNRVAAYLGSTNAMAYFSAKREVAKMSKEELARWMKFSVPEVMNKNETYDLFNVEGVNYTTILQMLVGTYTLVALPSDSLGKMMDHFGMQAAGWNNIRGFVEIPPAPDDPGVTNWQANKITAPINWADGKTITVEDGRFVARGGAGAWLYVARNRSITNAHYQVGTQVKTCTQGITNIGNGDYFLHVPYDLQNQAYVNQSSTVSNCFNVLVISVFDGRQTYSISALPTVLMYE